MKSILNYLDDLKEKNGSDYKTAQMLKITKESVSQIRKRGTVSDETAVKMADLLGINQSEVLIAAAIARSEGDVKSAWVKISKMSGIAASVLMICILAGLPIDQTEEGINSYKSIIYIMRSSKYCKIIVVWAC